MGSRPESHQGMKVEKGRVNGRVWWCVDAARQWLRRRRRDRQTSEAAVVLAALVLTSPANFRACTNKDRPFVSKH